MSPRRPRQPAYRAQLAASSSSIRDRSASPRQTEPAQSFVRERSTSPADDDRPLISARIRPRSQPLGLTPLTAGKDTHGQPGSAAIEEAPITSHPRTLPAERNFSNSSSRTVAESPEYPANLAHARGRIVSNSSTRSRSVSAGSVSSMQTDMKGAGEIHLTIPTDGAYPAGLSPLESCLACYPVFVSLLRELPTPDILTLRSVSKTFRAHLDTEYKAQIGSMIVLSSDRQWLYVEEKFVPPRGEARALALEWTYAFLRAYVPMKILEERRILERTRGKYDYEVESMLVKELDANLLGPPPMRFVSGGGNAERVDMQSYLTCPQVKAFRRQARRVQKQINAAYRVPLGTKKHHYSLYDGPSFLKLTERMNMLNGEPLAGTLKVLVLDGTNVDCHALKPILDLCGERLEGVSAVGCDFIPSAFWCEWMEAFSISGRALGLKWLNVYPSCDFPTWPYAHRLSLQQWFHSRVASTFPYVMPIQDHLSISVPLFLSMHPRDGHNFNHNVHLAKLIQMQRDVERFYSSLEYDVSGRFSNMTYIEAAPPVLKLLALCLYHSVDLDYSLCAMGAACKGFASFEKEKRRNGPFAPMIGPDPTHTFASRRRRKEQGGEKCSVCGVWEWEELKGRNTPKFLMEQFGLGSRFRPDHDGSVFEYDKDTETKVSYRLVIGYDEQTEVGASRAFAEIGGVKMVKVVKRTEVGKGVDAQGQRIVTVDEEEIKWPVRMGVGCVCEDCEDEMTCWGCGKFFCQLCLYSKQSTRMHISTILHSKYLSHACAQGKHGPFCSTCLPLYSETCAGCKFKFCSICNYGGYEIEKYDSKEYKLMNRSELDEEWEEEAWADLGSDSSDDGIDLGEGLEPGGGGEHAMLLPQRDIMDIGNIRMDPELEEINPNPRPYYQLPARVPSPPPRPNITEYLPPRTFLSNNNDPQHPPHTHPIHNPHVPIPPPIFGNINYDHPAAHHPTLHTKSVNAFSIIPQSLIADQGYTAIQIYVKCHFCGKVLCAVCTEGRTMRTVISNAAKERGTEWDWDRCAGCGWTICKGCCNTECESCERRLCEKCWEKEYDQEVVLKEICKLGPREIPTRVDRETGQRVQLEVYEWCARCEVRAYLSRTNAEKKGIAEGVGMEAGMELLGMVGGNGNFPGDNELVAMGLLDNEPNKATRKLSMLCEP